jgi:hypothetical protein
MIFDPELSALAQEIKETVDLENLISLGAALELEAHAL